MAAQASASEVSVAAAVVAVVVDCWETLQGAVVAVAATWTAWMGKHLLLGIVETLETRL